MGLKREQLKSSQKESTTDWGSSLTFTQTRFPLAHLKLNSVPSPCSLVAQMTFRWWKGKASRSNRVKNTSLKSLGWGWQLKTSEHFHRRQDGASSLMKATHIPLFTLGTLQTIVSLSVAWGRRRRQLDVCLGTYLRWGETICQKFVSLSISSELNHVYCDQKSSSSMSRVLFKEVEEIFQIPECFI